MLLVLWLPGTISRDIDQAALEERIQCLLCGPIDRFGRQCTAYRSRDGPMAPYRGGVETSPRLSARTAPNAWSGQHIGSEGTTLIVTGKPRFDVSRHRRTGSWLKVEFGGFGVEEYSVVDRSVLFRRFIVGTAPPPNNLTSEVPHPKHGVEQEL